MRAPTRVVLHFDSSRMVTYDELDKLRQQPRSLILGARGKRRFRGDSEPIDRVAGHVPGAHNRPFSQNLTTDSRFKPPKILRKEFNVALAGRVPGDVVHMCGSGVYACDNQLAMEVAGLHGSRVFIPSWSDWSSDPADRLRPAMRRLWARCLDSIASLDIATITSLEMHR